MVSPRRLTSLALVTLGQVTLQGLALALVQSGTSHGLYHIQPRSIGGESSPALTITQLPMLVIQSLLFLQVCSGFPFLLYPVLVVCTFPGVCPFHLSYLIYWFNCL